MLVLPSNFHNEILQGHTADFDVVIGPVLLIRSSISSWLYNFVSDTDHCIHNPCHKYRSGRMGNYRIRNNKIKGGKSEKDMLNKYVDVDWC